MSTKAMRDAFEAWFRDKYDMPSNIPFEWSASTIVNMFEAWKASRAGTVSAPVSPVGVAVSFDNPHVSGTTGCVFAESAVPAGTNLYAALAGASLVAESTPADGGVALAKAWGLVCSTLTELNGGPQWIYGAESMPDKVVRTIRALAAGDLPIPHFRSMLAYSAIVSERNRQDAQWGGAAHDDKHEIGEWFGFIENQTSLAHAGIGDLRERLIKIAALAVAAIESLDRRAVNEVKP